MNNIKKKSNIFNNNGFTLIELLAVIVVLSIIMLISVYAIMPQVEKARKEALKIEAEGLVKSAETYIMELNLNGESVQDGCYITLKQLQDNGETKIKNPDYSGFVLVHKATAPNSYEYTVSLQNKFYKIAGATDVEKATVVEKDGSNLEPPAGTQLCSQEETPGGTSRP